MTVGAEDWPASCRASFAAAAGLGATLVAVKAVALVGSRFRFGRYVALRDVLQGMAGDVVVISCFFLAAALLRALHPARAGGRWRTLGRKCCATLQVLLAVAATSVAIFTLLCAYVFWEWGSFLDRGQLEMVFRSPSPESMRWYVLRPAFVAVLAAFAGVAAVGRAAHGALRRRALPAGAWVVALLGLVAAWRPAQASALRPWQRDPAAASPLLLALAFRDPAISSSLGDYPLPPATQFRYDSPRPPAPEWQSLRGRARDRDLILLALESARRSNVQPYGYYRPTMPNLTRMAAHGLLFQRAYVSQPRSSKALEALVYGVYPDPRMAALSWNPARLEGKRNLFGILQGAGYRLYFGVAGRKEWDGFQDLLDRAAAFERMAGIPELQRKFGPLPQPSLSKDAAVVHDFLNWYAARPGPAAALLWFAAGHHPYDSPFKVFAERNEVDRYDNCLRSADRALGTLLTGLRQIGKRPLVLVFGDHGEAFGEHLGDVLHGNYLYDQSVRVPLLLWDPELFPRGGEVEARFTLKDVPATLLFLMGEDERLWQSEVIFGRQAGDSVYLSTIYGDHKLGVIAGNEKFVFRPQRGVSYLFDLEHDPDERRNLIPLRPLEEIQRRQRDLLAWYAYQTAWHDENFPDPSASPAVDPALSRAAAPPF